MDRSLLQPLLCAVAIIASVPQSTLAQPQIRIGGSSSGANVNLGAVTAALTLGDGRLVVLDATEPAIYLINRSGTGSFRTGRKGRGPGEMQTPVRIDLSALGEIVVYDKALRRFSWFAAVGDSLRFVRSASIQSSVQDFCTVGPFIYTFGFPGRPIAIYSATPAGLRLVDSLGTSNLRHPLAKHPIVRAFGLAGPIGCNKTAKSALWHSSQLDAGQYIDVASRKEVAARLLQFLQVVITPVERGVANSSPPGGKIEMVRSIVPATDSSFFVNSIIQSGRDGATTGYRMRTMTVSGQVSAPIDVGMLLHSFVDGTAVCEPLLDVPELIVVRNISPTSRYPCPSSER